MRAGKTTSFAALVILLLAIAMLQYAVSSRPAERAGLYAAQNRHPWNRVQNTLIARQSAGGDRFGDNELDPLLWPDSDHLLAGASGAQSLQVLDEFLARDHDQLIRDPLKRAVLQHDLWGLFDWLVDPNGTQFPRRTRSLRRRVAQIIRRLALSSDEIECLPDNYAAVAASEPFGSSSANDASARRHLPKDLFDAGGPWVQLAYEDNGRIGTAHEENSATLGRSAFLMFVRVPGDEGAEQLVDRFNAWADHESSQSDETRRRAGYPSFQLPVGSQVALVRRMLVIDDRGIVRQTNITERIQLRLLDDVRAEEQTIEPRRFLLFGLNRRQLLAGNSHRSLDFVSDREKGFELGPIRMPTSGDPFAAGLQPLQTTTVMETCSQCHKHHGLLGWARDRFSSLGTRPRNLRVCVKKNGDAIATAQWKATRTEVSLLRDIVSEIEPFKQ